LGGKAQGRLYFVGRRLYRVVARANFGDLPDKDVSAFLDSFKITGQ